MRRSAESSSQGEVVVANGFHVQGGLDFNQRHPLAEEPTPQSTRLLGHVDLTIGIPGTIIPDQMTRRREVLTSLERINEGVVRGEKPWEGKGPVQEEYLRLNREVTLNNFWGNPSDGNLSPIARAQAALNK